MKRKFGCGIAALVLLLALGISGCPTEPGEEEKGDPSLSWANGAANALTFEVGDNVGEIKYSIELTNEEADSYTLFYAKEMEYDIAKIIVKAAANTPPTVIPVVGTQSGTITGLGDGQLYSAVLVVKKSGYADTSSGVKQTESKASASLTKIRIINMPVGGDSDEDVNFFWINVDPEGKTRKRGFGVWGGVIKTANNPDKAITVPDNEIKDNNETSPTGTGYAETKLFDANSVLNLLMYSAGMGGSNTMPIPSQVTGTGTIQMEVTIQKDGENATFPAHHRKWENVVLKNDEGKEYLELDYTDGTLVPGHE